jgi:tetratricopeptide (TPR) repeat protein
MNPAIAAARRALDLTRSSEVKISLARTFLLAGDEAEARRLASDLTEDDAVENQAYAKVVDGEIAYQRHNVAAAIDSFRAAQGLADLWLAQYDLGVAYVESGDYTKGLEALETCQKRRGEATAFLFDDVPTFRQLAHLPYWIARAHEGLGMKAQASENYKRYLVIRAATRDPLSEDARRRLKGLSPS